MITYLNQKKIKILNSNMMIKNIYSNSIKLIVISLICSFSAFGQVGIGTTDPKSSFEVQGSVGYKVSTITSATTLDDTYHVVLCNNGPYTVTLPAAATNAGRIYKIKNIDAQSDAITIDGNGSETIDGALTYNLQPYKHSVTIISDGNNWHIIEDISIFTGGVASLLTCSSATNNGTLVIGVAANSVSSDIPYTGGNGGTHVGQTVTSTGVTGLTATLTAGTFASGSGTLTYIITGTPASSGTASFAINIGGQTCTLTRTVNALNTAGVASSTPTLCINTALTNITHTTTGATGIGAATGLPAGVTAAWASNTITISGTPTANGTFNYSIPLTGGFGTVNATGTITVTAANTAGAASSTPTLCVNTALTNITHTTTGATGIGAATGLPAGVSAAWASNTITISGTPTASGTFNYSIPLTGGCGSVNATGTITVTAANTAGAASSTPTLCVNTALTNITHTTTGATGIGTATGLPAGVTAAWASNTITISGTPTASGTFNYSIPLTGGCGSVNATGTITVTAANTAGAASSTPTLCINTALTNITHTTTRATGIGTATGLPAGVTAAWASNTITISGTPTASGTFNYSIPLTGGCGSVNATGTITVTAVNTAGAASSTPTLCVNTALTNITHTTTGATGIGTATGLPAGVTAAWASNTITISGTPTASGTFNYSIPLTGGCGSVNATGTITVTAANTAGAASSTPTLCVNTALTNITHTTTGATGIGTATGLPAGVTAAWASNTITISGTPTANGTFNYSIPLTGGCGSVNATGTITVTSSGVPNTCNPSNPTEIVDVVSTTGKTWMDRNLGATRKATSSTDTQSYGSLYQWGRGSDGHQCVNRYAGDGVTTASTTSTNSSTDTPGHGNFIIETTQPLDWRSPQNNNLWQGVNGINNPCPSGYRLPTEAEWNAELTALSITNASTAFSSVLKLPMAGGRGADGSSSNVGTRGYYWSSTVNSTLARNLNFTSSNLRKDSYARADALSVRCIKN
jgi:uncharacterized protein (TIGR02145 family)